MQALRLRENVKDGKIVLTIPKEFGPVVEIILLAPSHDDVEFWSEDEIRDLGKTRVQSGSLDIPIIKGVKFSGDPRLRREEIY